MSVLHSSNCMVTAHASISHLERSREIALPGRRTPVILSTTLEMTHDFNYPRLSSGISWIPEVTDPETIEHEPSSFGALRMKCRYSRENKRDSSNLKIFLGKEFTKKYPFTQDISKNTAYQSIEDYYMSHDLCSMKHTTITPNKPNFLNRVTCLGYSFRGEHFA